MDCDILSCFLSSSLPCLSGHWCFLCLGYCHRRQVVFSPLALFLQLITPGQKQKMLLPCVHVKKGKISFADPSKNFQTFFFLACTGSESFSNQMASYIWFVLSTRSFFSIFRLQKKKLSPDFLTWSCIEESVRISKSESNRAKNGRPRR